MTFPCGVCEKPIVGPFMVDAAGREVCQACAEAAAVQADCLLCRKPTSRDDALECKNGVTTGVAHFECIGRAQRAFGWERSSMLVRRSGPAFAKKAVA